MAPTKPSRTLTDVELELMTILWRLGQASVNDVLAQLPPERPLAYTSVATVLRILEDKGFLKTRKEGRAHVFLPTLTKDAYEARSVRRLLDDIFEGEATSLVRCLIENERLSSGELSELRALIAQAERKRR